MKRLLFAGMLVASGIAWWAWPKGEAPVAESAEESVASQAAGAAESADRMPAADSEARSAASSGGANVVAVDVSIRRLETTQACYESEACDYPKTDARSYAFAVGQDLKNQLEQLTASVKLSGEKSPAIAEAARKHLENEDGHVQAAALALLATQETSGDILETILKSVIEGYDAQLIQAALGQLLRYQAEDDRAKITETLANVMATGAPFVSKEISGSIRPFVYARSVPNFEQAVTQLPEGSVVRINLVAALSAFRQGK